MTDYLLHTGLDYPLNPDAPRAEWTMVRHEAGETVSDLPAISIPWLRDGGLIEEVAAPPEATSGEPLTTDAVPPPAAPAAPPVADGPAAPDAAGVSGEAAPAPAPEVI